MLLLTKTEEKKYKKQKHFHKCKEKFNNIFNEHESYDKICNHCDYTGKIGGFV